jgi:soluble lytic murein transglycosylase-like protein
VVYYRIGIGKEHFMDYTAIILLAAKKIGIAGSLLLAICTHETGLKNNMVHIDGGSPSYGVCQVKIGTAKMMNYEVTGKDLMNPEVNAVVAASYLKYQIDRYNGNLCKATASFNSGRYNPSDKAPGHPRNLKYLRSVQKLLDPSLRPQLQRCEL